MATASALMTGPNTTSLWEPDTLDRLEESAILGVADQGLEAPDFDCPSLLAPDPDDPFNYTLVDCGDNYTILECGDRTYLEIDWDA